jgi:hypothetical protein
MDKEFLEQCLQHPENYLSPELIPEATAFKFSDYFSKEVSGPCSEKIISDESLFRDYSRLGGRKVDFSRVRNPFTLSKYAVSSYERTWYIQNEKGETEGPFNSYDMDNHFKKDRFTDKVSVGISKQEFFKFHYFVEIVYPLPKIKQNVSQTNSNIKGVTLFASANKFSNIFDESDRMSNRSHTSDQAEDTPFKRTPFKHMPDSLVHQEGMPGENFIQIDARSKGFSSSKKNNFAQPTGNMIGERFLVKSTKQNRSKVLSQSSKDPSKHETSDITGKYTPIKRDADSRQYVDLNNKLDFHGEKVDEVVEPEEDFDQEVDFDEMGVSKKD